jgi:hypothetical protein
MNSRLSLCAAFFIAAFSSVRSASAEFIYGIATQGGVQALVGFDSTSPSNLQVSKILKSGNVPATEVILGIDMRPANNQIYALASNGRIYTINSATGDLTQVSPNNFNGLTGFSFGFDFNPQIDRIRVVSEANTNYVYNPNTGNLETTATNLAYGVADPNFGKDPNVVDSAYDNNVNGALSTQLYGIDTGLDILVKQANNAGTLTTVGPLGVNVAAAGGFDISGMLGQVAYAALLSANSSQSELYTINLLTGLATNLGVIDGGIVITALTVAPIPEPATAMLGLTGLVAVMGFRRRLS